MAANESRVIDYRERVARHGHLGGVVWLTGLSGAGKSTLAQALAVKLFDAGCEVVTLDGDRVRNGLNADLGFDVADRRENIRRVAEVAKVLAEAAVVAIAACISPYASDRLRAREIVAASAHGIPFVEVYLNASLEVCEARDPKGYYQRARSGGLHGFTGVESPYEPPERPDICIRSGELDLDVCVDLVYSHLLPLLNLRQA